MPFYQLAQERDTGGMGSVEYGPCKACGASTLVCPTTLTENGLICTTCIVAEVHAEEQVAPVKSRIHELEHERDQIQRRLGHIASELRRLHADLRRRGQYSSA